VFHLSTAQRRARYNYSGAARKRQRYERGVGAAVPRRKTAQTSAPFNPPGAARSNNAAQAHGVVAFMIRQAQATTRGANGKKAL